MPLPLTTAYTSSSPLAEWSSLPHRVDAAATVTRRGARLAGSVMSSPLSSIRPLDGCSKPTSSRASVLFPLPLSPTTATNSFCAMENEANPRNYLAHQAGPARFYVDSLVHDPDALRLLLKLFGPQRIAFGSDYPFPLGEAQPGKLIESIKELSTKQKAQLLSGTAREFLGLS